MGDFEKNKEASMKHMGRVESSAKNYKKSE